jgi:hypothetical protein
MIMSGYKKIGWGSWLGAACILSTGLMMIACAEGLETDDNVVGGPTDTDKDPAGGAGGDGSEDPGSKDPAGGAGGDCSEDPGSEDPGSEDPGSEDPGSEDPGSEDPGSEDPGSEDPGSEDPGSEDPTSTVPPITGPDLPHDPVDPIEPTAPGAPADDLFEPHAAFCAGQGAPIVVGDGVTTREECTGAIAERVFSHALCTCEDADIFGYLRTRSFHSRNDPTIVEAGAPVGVNERYLTAGVPNIGGSFTVAGSEGLTLAGALFSRGDLRINGPLLKAGYGVVDRDAYVNGNLLTLGWLDVGRDLIQPDGTGTGILVTPVGQTRREPVNIDPPCACEPDDILDIQALIEQGKQNNDNALAGVESWFLSAVVGARNLELPCGRYFFDSIGGLGVVNVRVTGRVAVFIEGSILTAGVLRFQVDPDAELDVFIGGHFVPTGLVTFGDASRPAASRIYVAGEGDMLLTGAGIFVGNLYAPRSRVNMVGYSDVYGSIFAEDFLAPGAVLMTYDRAILDAAEDCETDDDPPVCDRCGSCTAGSACVDVECGMCSADSDCCPPLVCRGNGSCGALLL